MSDPAKFRRELIQLSGMLGAACEGLAAAILKSIPANIRTADDAEMIHAADKLKGFAELLAHCDEGGNFFPGLH